MEVDTGYFSIKPRISGSFNDEQEIKTKGKERMDFAFKSLSPLCRLCEYITIRVDAATRETSFISMVNGSNHLTKQAVLRANEPLIVEGRGIKIEGGSPECGLYLIDEAGTKLAKLSSLLHNTKSKIMAIVPASLAGLSNVHVRIVTQHSGGGKMLERPKVIEFPVLFTIKDSIVHDARDAQPTVSGLHSP
jgi:hypothetical protein